MCCVLTAGDDDGRFLMNRETGEMKMVHSIGNRLHTPVLHLKVMVRLPADCHRQRRQQGQNLRVSPFFGLVTRLTKTTTPGSTLSRQLRCEFWR